MTGTQVFQRESDFDCGRMTYDELSQLPAALTYEWLETNGLGAYAMSTPLYCNTRKYHGLFVTPIEGTDERYALAAKIEPVLRVGSRRTELSVNRYPDVYHPHGHKLATEFRADPFPQLTLETDDISITISVMMPRGVPAVLLQYRIDGPAELWSSDVVLELTPLLAYRNSHAVGRENGFAAGDLERVGQEVSGVDDHGGSAGSRGSAGGGAGDSGAGGPSVRGTGAGRSGCADPEWVWAGSPYEGMPRLYYAFSRQTGFEPGTDWYRDFEYVREQERGYDHVEDLFTPGRFTVAMRRGQPLVVQLGTSMPANTPADAWDREEASRRNLAAIDGSPFAGGTVARLARNARHFVIDPQREGKASIVAGFPWFGEWGRDAMIALPGLMLSVSNADTAFEVLRTYASYRKNGVLPNQLGVRTSSSFNTVDAALWFFWAVQQYCRHTGKVEMVVERLGPAMRDILTAYLEQRVPNVTMDENGLLAAGDPKTQLTWMDAEVEGVPVTPRHGYAVEINALWYNALCFYRDVMPEGFSGPTAAYANVIDNLQSKIVERFTLPTQGFLADVVSADGTMDASIRPNQIFAASLPYPVVDSDQARHIVDVVEAELLTPYGLRTLSPAHPSYCCRYRGDQAARDRAYHQGTVWPWLIGHFCDAFVRVHRGESDKLRALSERVSPLFVDHVCTHGIGFISEVFDGSSPQTPGGCPMQAWSVAEVLRAYRTLRTAIGDAEGVETDDVPGAGPGTETGVRTDPGLGRARGRGPGAAAETGGVTEAGPGLAGGSAPGAAPESAMGVGPDGASGFSPGATR